MKQTKVKRGDRIERRDDAGLNWFVEILDISGNQVTIRAFDRAHGHIRITKEGSVAQSVRHRMNALPDCEPPAKPFQVVTRPGSG